MTASVIFPNRAITPLGSARALSGTVPEISWVGADGSIFYLQGAMAPDLSVDDGIALLDIEGMQAPLVLIDEQGARQDGTTNLDVVFDPANVTLKLEASGATPGSLRNVVRTWMSSWNPPNVGILSVFTQDLGQWWLSLRQRKNVDTGAMKGLDPSLHRRLRFDWEARADNAFWQGIDSVSVFAAGDSQEDDVTGFCPLTNLGTRPAWPRYLCYGPGTFLLGDGALPTTTGVISNSGKPITFGPLLDGQIAAVYTDPRLRGVVDLSPTQPAQNLTAFQALVTTMVNSVAGAYPVPPLLQDLESLFGILPPQGPLYSLLQGRFTSLSALPAKRDGYPPQTTYIPVGISGISSASKIIAAATPYRTWPW